VVSGRDELIEGLDPLSASDLADRIIAVRASRDAALSPGVAPCVTAALFGAHSMG
jgi:hypothetical protein